MIHIMVCAPPKQLISMMMIIKGTAINIFLENIKQSLKHSLTKGNSISEYYLPDLLPYTLRLCKHFFPWINVFSNIFQFLF